MKTKVSLEPIGDVEQKLEVFAFDIGEFYVCRSCGILGFNLDEIIRAKIQFPIRALTAKDIVAEMDVKDTYEDVPFCISCGDKVVSRPWYSIVSGEFEKLLSKASSK